MSGISKDDELEEGGDLGLGRGLKPGGIPNVDLHSESDNFTHLKNRPRSPSVPLLNRCELDLIIDIVFKDSSSRQIVPPL